MLSSILLAESVCGADLGHVGVLVQNMQVVVRRDAINALPVFLLAQLVHVVRSVQPREITKLL